MLFLRSCSARCDLRACMDGVFGGSILPRGRRVENSGQPLPHKNAEAPDFPAEGWAPDSNIPSASFPLRANRKDRIAKPPRNFAFPSFSIKIEYGDADIMKKPALLFHSIR